MEIKELLKQSNFEFKKKFGQNFIKDDNLLKSICDDANLIKDDEVLEIGVGAGTLTKILSGSSKKVVGYEIDKSLKNVLEISLAGLENVQIVFKDFLREEPESVNSNFSGKYKVVANLPYYITSNIIFRLIEKDFNVESMTLMVQKEVAERLTAPCGTKDYGTITAELQSVGDVSLCQIVDRKMFEPMPNVDSAVINIVLNKNKFDIKNLELHRKVIKSAFSMRRKTLLNCLKSNFDIKSESLLAILQKLGLESNIRGEALSVEQFVSLSNAIYDFQNN